MKKDLNQKWKYSLSKSFRIQWIIDLFKKKK